MTALDYGLVGLYVAGILLIGSLFVPGQNSLKDFLLGGRRIPWWAAAFSGIATIESAIGYLGQPGLAFGSDWTYLQTRLGLPVVILATCVLFIPFFYKLDVYSVYEYLERRFDRKTRLLAAGLFLVQKCLYAGVAIFAPALVVAEMTGLPLNWIVLGIGVFTTTYTMLGGMRAVIWTDAAQLFVLTGGVVATLYILLGRLESGFLDVALLAYENDKLRVLDFSASFETEFTVLGGLLGGTFYLLSQYAVDQVELQRFLTTRSVKSSQLAFVSTITATVALGVVLFFIGTALWLFYEHNTGMLGSDIEADQVFPKFILEEFPAGFRGLLLAAILAAAMSSVSSLLNSLTTVALRDFVQPLTRHQGSVRFARILTVVFGGIAALVSLYSGSLGGILVGAAKIRNFFGGSLVGVFLLGLLFPRANARGAFLGMLLGFGGVAWLSSASSVSWLWYSVSASSICIGSGILISRFSPPPRSSQLAGLVWKWRGAVAQSDGPERTGL